MTAQTRQDDAEREAQPEELAIRALPPEAQRALAEAEDRRRARAERAEAREIGGRGGLDPARYGDWEIKGIASDF